MANRVSGKKLISTSVYLTEVVYSAWLEKLTAKELSMCMLPISKQEFESIEEVDRKECRLLPIQMPSWWVNWYRQLSREDKFRFARVIEIRLKNLGLIGGE